MKSLKRIPNRFRKYFIFLFVSSTILFLPLISSAQLSGTYTIGTGGSYVTFTEAANALHNNGVNGPVTFNVLSGTYNEQFVMGKIPGAGENAAVIFQSASGDSTDVIVQYGDPDGANNFVILLNSVKYVIFRSITFRATNAEYSRTVVFDGVTDHITFSHCVFKGSSYIHGGSEHALLFSVKRIRSLTLESNAFSLNNYGICFLGAANDTIQVEIKNNTFDSLAYGIYLKETITPVITGNAIIHCDNGIYLTMSKGGANISGNNIDVSLTGVYLNSFSSTAGKEALISNNMIAINRENVSNSGYGGIYLESSNHINVFYNTLTVYIDPYNNSRALTIGNCEGSSIDVVNNNLVSLHDGYAFYSDQNTGVLGSCDYNNFYSAGYNLAVWCGTKCSDLTSLKNVSGDNVHSVFVDPEFVSVTDLHVTSEALNGAGVPVQGITEDIDGDTRDPQYPDIGADEFGILPPVFTGNFELANIPLDQLSLGTGLWTDIGTDGDMDILLGGVTETNEYEVKLYYNNGDGNLIPGNVIANIFPEQFDAAAWGDFDNDGDPDLIITGKKKVGVVQSPVTKLFQVDNGQFTEMNTDILSVNSGSVDWGDFDHDGDLDLLIGGNETKIYRNDGSGGNHNWIFTDVKTLPGSGSGSAKWGDYDCDGNLDIFISPAPLIHEVWLYKNTGEGNFTEVNTGITNVNGRSVWFDYNMDGFPDITIEGDSLDNSVITKIYRNYQDGSGRKFTDIQAGLTGLYGGSLSWCDYDLDGDPDLLITGRDSTGETQTKLYDNMGEDRFEESESHFPKVTGSGSWGDLNNDEKPDLLLMGYHSDPDPARSGNITAVFINKTDSSIIPPEPLEQLYCTLLGTTAWLEWLPSDDQAGLTYNVKIGTTPAGSEIMSAMANYSTGYMYVPKTGNAGSNRAVIINDLQPGRTYYWSVQAVDPSFASSPFSEEMNFTTNAPYFEEAETNLQVFQTYDMNWVDFDSDGDLDMEITSEDFTEIYRNDGTDFVDIDAAFYDPHGEDPEVVTDVWNLSTEWGDFDNDGTPDLLIAGEMMTDNVISAKAKIYKNWENGMFTDLNPDIFNLWNGDVSWVDYDNDGDLDVFITGEYGMGKASKIYNNAHKYNGFNGDTNNVFIEGVSHGAVAWADYDKDGDMDLLLTGINNEGNAITKIYNNEGGIMRPSPTDNLPGVAYSSIDWGDCNSDGYPDILLSGKHIENNETVSYITEILYNHQHGGFIPTELSPPLESRGIVCAWNDVDNDGDLDIVFSGKKESGVYLNDNQTFTRIDRYFLVGDNMSLVSGDYDNDGGMDLFITGEEAVYDPDLQEYQYGCKLYHHKNTSPNHDPEPPVYLHAYYDPASDSTMFMWSYGHDTETRREGLSYNLRIGTTPGGSEIMSAMADPATGFRKVVNEGNAGQNLSWKIKGLTVGDTIYWSVQSIDNSLRGSPFAPEQSFIVAPTYNVTGDVYTSDMQPLSRAEVYVYSINDEGVPSVSFIYSLDGTNHFSLVGVPQGEVTLRVMPDIIFYPDYAPAYLGNTIFYSEATRLNVDQNIGGLEILVERLDALQGTIGVEGSMSMDGGEGNVTLQVRQGVATEAGTPVPDVWVYLLDNKGKVIAWDVTDSLGYFNFDSIPIGHYSFYADYKGWPMDTANDSLIFDQENHSYALSAVAEKSGITLTLSDVTAIHEEESVPGIIVFPNPVKDNLYVRFDNEISDDVKVKIAGINGKIIKTVLLPGVTKYSISEIFVNDLPNGIYIISIEGGQCNYKARIVKIK